MGVTTKDLARICGVSRTTINRALYGTGRISEETKDKILKTARDLDYQPDLLARSLVKGTTMCIGIIVVDLRNQYFPKMINAMEHQAKKYGYLLNITLHEQNKQTEMDLIRTLVGHRVDGLIISSANKGPDFEKYLLALPIPVVMIGNNLSDRITCVGIDEYAATVDACEYILGDGYQKVVFIAPPLKKKEEINNSGHEQRLAGYLESMAAHGLSEEVMIEEEFCEEAEKILKGCNLRTAFLCSGDIFAVKLMSYFTARKIKTPRDYGLMGFDCIDIFRNWSPKLASVNNHIDEIGSSAIDLIIEMLEKGASSKSLVISHDIMLGDTIVKKKDRRLNEELVGVPEESKNVQNGVSGPKGAAVQKA